MNGQKPGNLGRPSNEVRVLTHREAMPESWKPFWKTPEEAEEHRRWLYRAGSRSRLVLKQRRDDR